MGMSPVGLESTGRARTRELGYEYCTLQAPRLDLNLTKRHYDGVINNQRNQRRSALQLGHLALQDSSAGGPEVSLLGAASSPRLP